MLCEVAADADFHVEPHRVMRETSRILFKFDNYVRRQRRWRPLRLQEFVRQLFRALGVVEHEVDALVGYALELDRTLNLWTFTLPFVPQTLDRLRRSGYAMSVISNADGRVAQMLRELELADYFEAIFDSAVVGIEKPDPGIFRYALAQLDVKPERVIYIGDVFFLDVWGANRAHAPALHLDPCGFYRKWPGVHIPDISVLPEWLQSHARNPNGYDLMPARDFELKQD